MFDFNLFPRRHPSLPQQDNNRQQQQRIKQLESAQETYEWTNTLPNVEGVPMAADVHFSDEPSLAWLLLVSEVGLAIAENLLAVKILGSDDGSSHTDTQEKLSSVRQRLSSLQEIHSTEHGGVDDSFVHTIIKTAKQLIAEHNLSFDDLVAQFQLLAYNNPLNTAKILESNAGLEAYNHLFQTLPLPALASTFLADSTFARLYVAGSNPMLIKGISQLPEKFPLNEAQYQTVMGNEDSLAQAGAEHRLYLLDYVELDYLAAVSGVSGSTAKYVYAPIVLFAIVKGATTMMPVAIRCGQDAAIFPLFLAVDATQPPLYWGWQMAKTIVQVADGNYHELFIHLARTHLVMEAFTVATHRYLANCHPLNILLVPHFEGTLFINNAAASSLISPNGPIDHIFAAPIERTQQAAGTDRLNFDFYGSMLPTDLATRCVNDPAFFPDYPYRDDALLVWSAIQQWATHYLNVYYADDEAVLADTELAAWTASLMGEGKIKGFKPITSRQQLAEVVTMIIYTGSAQHAAVNFPQKPLMTYAPALSGASWQPAPTQDTGYTEQDWLTLLPPIKQSFEQLNVLYLLGSVHYRHLGEYRSNAFPYLEWFEDKAITQADGPLAQFQQSLKVVEGLINERNSHRPPYEFLLPSLIPLSINI